MWIYCFHFSIYLSFLYQYCYINVCVMLKAISLSCGSISWILIPLKF